MYGIFLKKGIPCGLHMENAIEFLSGKPFLKGLSTMMQKL